MKSNNGAGGGSLTERDISDAPTPTKNADAALLPSSKVREALIDIAPRTNLNRMSSKRIGAVSSNNNWGFRLIFGPGRAPPRAAESMIGVRGRRDGRHSLGRDKRRGIKGGRSLLVIGGVATFFRLVVLIAASHLREAYKKNVEEKVRLSRELEEEMV